MADVVAKGLEHSRQSLFPLRVVNLLALTQNITNAGQPAGRDIGGTLHRTQPRIQFMGDSRYQIAESRHFSCTIS